MEFIGSTTWDDLDCVTEGTGSGLVPGSLHLMNRGLLKAEGEVLVNVARRSDP